MSEAESSNPVIVGVLPQAQNPLILRDFTTVTSLTKTQEWLKKALRTNKRCLYLSYHLGNFKGLGSSMSGTGTELSEKE